MLATLVKCGARVSAKSPAPHWASTRRVGGGGKVFDGFADADVGGKMASRTYEVKGTNTVILKERARLVIEEQVVDALPDGRFVIGDADVIVFDSKLRGGCRGVVAWYPEQVVGRLFYMYISFCVRPIQRKDA